MVSVIIPAYNEGSTIAAVVSILKKHPLIGEVIVVDDGSTDGTAARARSAGATVIIRTENGGKAAAMHAGVAAAHYDVVCFFDGDLVGLTNETVTDIVTPVLAGTYDMFVALRGRGHLILNKLLRLFPIISGERALRKEVWYLVPQKYKKDFQIEIALNYYTKRAGKKMGFTFIKGLSHVIKEKKLGLIPGLRARGDLIRDILFVSVRLYILETLGDIRKRNSKKISSIL